MDRNKNKIVDFEIGDRSFSTYLKMALRLKDKYNIKYLCTDDYDAYKKFTISKYHTTTKAETALVEAKNSSLRDNLARLNRRTKKYSKSLQMLWNSILLHINRELAWSINYL